MCGGLLVVFFLCQRLDVAMATRRCHADLVFHSPPASVETEIKWLQIFFNVVGLRCLWTFFQHFGGFMATRTT